MSYLYKYLIEYSLNLNPTSIATDVLGINFTDAENAPLTQTILANSEKDAIMKSKNEIKAFLYNSGNIPFATLTGTQDQVFDEIFVVQNIVLLQ